MPNPNFHLQMYVIWGVHDTNCSSTFGIWIHYTTSKFWVASKTVPPETGTKKESNILILKVFTGRIVKKQQPNTFLNETGRIEKFFGLYIFWVKIEKSCRNGSILPSVFTKEFPGFRESWAKNLTGPMGCWLGSFLHTSLETTVANEMSNISRQLPSKCLAKETRKWNNQLRKLCHLYPTPRPNA